MIVAIVNEKGGCGKSVTAANLGYTLTERGRRVLLVDFDPQGNLTTALGVDKRSLGRTVQDVAEGVCGLGEAVVDAWGVSLLPATIDLAALAVKPEEGGTRGLASAIRGARYDYILVDTPTGLGGFTLSALHLADAVLIPVQTEFLSLEGLVQVMRVLSILSKRGRGPGVLGILPTMYDARTKSSRDALRDIRTHFGSPVFNTVIPRNVAVTEATARGEPVASCFPDSKAAKAYTELAAEVEGRANTGTAWLMGAGWRRITAESEGGA